MRSSSLILIIGLIFILLTDYILWSLIKQHLRKKWQLTLYILHSLFFVVSLVAFQLLIPHLKGPDGYFWIGKLFGILFTFYVPKLIFILFQGISFAFRKILPRLSHFISYSGKILCLLLFLILIYSITLGRYNFKTEIVNVPISYLPKSFENFKIVQLSDIHLGSYGKSYRGLQKMVNQVNQLQPDLIVFTGDMVNNFATEMPQWISTLKALKAPYGKYAITGNHDYGDYTQWPDESSKQQNLKDFFKNMQEMGFQMLNNAHIPLISNMDTLWLAGVENWGNPPFPRYGNLNQALDSLPNNQVIILLSHDPSHWRAEILDHDNIALTLSGHTHAMQMGVKIGNWKWSPSKYIYPEYDGLYQEADQYLYVSRGQGYLGYPGRIGLRPVITELVLTSKP